MELWAVLSQEEGVMGRIVPGRGSYGPYCPRKRELWAVLSQEEGLLGARRYFGGTLVLF